MEEISRCTGFQWDEGNCEKNWEKHRVSRFECEQLFFNKPLLVYKDEQHSLAENRYYVLGKTNQNRELFIVFTIRDDQIRVISARSMSRRERRCYENAKEKQEYPAIQK